MHSMSGDVWKSVSSSALARLRSANWPIWLPTVASIARSSSSGRAISRLKNSSTPRTCSPRRMGVPRAPRSPSWLATFARGKLSSAETSGMKAGRRLSHTRPGRPTPGAKVALRLASSNAVNARPGVCQVSTHRRTPAAPAIRHSPPWSQPSASQIARRTRGAASASDELSARARATAYCAWRRRTASFSGKGDVSFDAPGLPRV